MKEVINYILNNKEWVFSGIGVSLIIVIINILICINKKSKSKNRNDEMISITGSGNTTIMGNGNIIDSQAKEDALVQFVEFGVDESDEDGFPVLDIKLRNIGDEPAFIKKLKINVHECFTMQNPQVTYYERVESTFTYDALLSGDEDKVVHLSQCIKASDIDRFQVKLASSHEDPNVPHIYEISVNLIYNEKDDEIESPRIIIPIPSIVTCDGYYISHTSMEIAKENFIKLKELSDKKVLKSERFVAIYESYNQNRSDFINC